MSNNEQALQRRETVELAPESHFSRSQVELIKRTVCRGTTDDELRLFLTVAQRSGLDPFTHQIHAVKRWDSDQGDTVMAIQTGIDGYRLIAQRSDEYEGQAGPQWCGDDGVWWDVWTSEDPPVAARVGVYRRGFREPAWGVAHYAGYVQRRTKDGAPVKRWRTDPAGMLAKCAEALALRKSFPRELSGLYADVEMHQADADEAAPKVQMPSRKSDKAAPSPPPDGPSWEGIIAKVAQKSGETKGGKPWTLYIIKAQDGTEFTTFDEAHAAFARDAGMLPITVHYKVDAKGRKNVVAIEPIPGDAA